MQDTAEGLLEMRPTTAALLVRQVEVRWASGVVCMCVFVSVESKRGGRREVAALGTGNSFGWLLIFIMSFLTSAIPAHVVASLFSSIYFSVDMVCFGPFIVAVVIVAAVVVAHSY